MQRISKIVLIYIPISTYQNMLMLDNKPIKKMYAKFFFSDAKKFNNRKISTNKRKLLRKKTGDIQLVKIRRVIESKK